MSTNLDRCKEELTGLISLGNKMLADLRLQYEEAHSKSAERQKAARKAVTGEFARSYQTWYSKSQRVVQQLLPNRLGEFDGLYRSDTKRRQVGTLTYTLEDWILGMRSTTDAFEKKVFDDISVAYMKFNNQLQILGAASSRFESSLYDIQQLVVADLFDSELDTATSLAKSGFLRASGAIAGVVLEKHLGHVCIAHKIAIQKKQPTISDYNDLLKNADVIDVPNWRFIQRLGDIRNLCSHDKGREPTNDEVSDLILGVGKVSKTLF